MDKTCDKPTPRLNIRRTFPQKMLSQPMTPTTTYVLPRVPWYLANGLIREFKEDLENVDAHKSKMQDCFSEMKEAHEAELSQTSHDLERLCYYQSYRDIVELMEYMKTLANDFREVDGYITRLSYRYEYGNSEFMEMTEADRRDRSFLRMQIHQLYVDYGYKFLKKCASMRKEWEYVLQELDAVRRDL